MRSSEGYNASTLILVVVATVVATVVALELSGALRHNADKDAVPVGEFKAIFLEPGEQARLSSKAPELHAQCLDGYLVIASNTDTAMRGVLVDYKNRAVNCTAELSNPTEAPRTEANPEQ